MSGLITESLTALIRKNAIYHNQNMDSKLINIAHCKSWKNVFLDLQNAILIGYY